MNKEEKWKIRHWILIFILVFIFAIGVFDITSKVLNGIANIAIYVIERNHKIDQIDEKLQAYKDFVEDNYQRKSVSTTTIRIGGKWEETDLFRPIPDECFAWIRLSNGKRGECIMRHQ